MPRTKGEFASGFNRPRFVPLLRPLGIGQYIKIDMSAYDLKPDTICAYVEQAACILSITTRSCRDGETLYVGRFRNPLVNDMKLSGAERKQRIETIRSLAGTMSNWEIADRLGITPANLNYIASTNKISLKYYDNKAAWTPDRDEALIGYLLEGKTSREIGTLLGVSRATVDMRAAKLAKQGAAIIQRRKPGGYRRGQVWTEPLTNTLISLWNCGASPEDICAALPGISWNAIKRKAQDLRDRGADVIRRAPGVRRAAA